MKNENDNFGYLDKSDYSLFVVEFSIRICTHSADARWKSEHYFNIRKANFMHMIDFLRIDEDHNAKYPINYSRSSAYTI